MKLIWDHLEKHRIGGDRGQTYGSFALTLNHPDGNLNKDWYAQVIAASAFPETEGWEHVSVCMRGNKPDKFRIPSWDEMCQIKDLFWNEDETVIQFHPKKSEYVTLHQYVLHLWRNTLIETQLPPTILTGPVGSGLFYNEIQKSQ